MNIAFYIASVLAIISTLLAITGKNAVHALLYFITSLLSVSVVFFVLGAAFIAALEVMIYAGAIMVLFVFVMMMMNMGADGVKKERALTTPSMWIGPSIISLLLFLEMFYILTNQTSQSITMLEVQPDAVGKLLFSKYIIVVELAAFLLTAGIIGAYHLAQKEKTIHHRFLQNENDNL
ncbi:MAG: NADH-quinone oxidoreductase subunit J [Bacteroidia bacterium]